MTVQTESSGAPATRRLQAATFDQLVEQAVRVFSDLGVKYDEIEDVSCRNVDTAENMTDAFTKPFLDML